MNKNIKRILFEKIKLLKLSEGEVFSKIIKSILQNNNISNSLRLYLRYHLTKSIRKKMFLSRKHKICILTGKRSSILNGFSFSRYNVKKLILKNKLTNFKKHN